MKTPGSKLLDRLNDFFWVALPSAACKVSRTLGAVLADGLYLVAFPWAGAVAPIIAITVGFLIGWLHPGYGYDIVYTASISAMFLMLAVGAASGGLGAWLWLGFITSDLFLGNHQWLRLEYETAPIRQIVRHRLPILIPDLFLVVLLAYFPLVSRVLSIRILGKRLRRNRGVRIAVQALSFAGLVKIWTSVAPLLVRPVYTWNGNVPSAGVIQPLQKYGWALAAAGGIIMALRCLVEDRQIRRLSVAIRARNVASTLLQSATTNSTKRPIFVSAVIKTCLLLTVLSGILTTWIEAVIVGPILFLLLIARERLSLPATRWGQWLKPIPVVVRFGVAVVTNYLIATLVLTTVWRTAQGLLPVLLSVIIGLAVFWVLMPSSALERER